MRTIQRLAAAFQLLDSCSKGPVLGASILVDGKREPLVARGDGIYVFSNLLPTPHTYQISAPGYRTVLRTLPAAPDHIPEIILMPYSTDGTGRPPLACFYLRFFRGASPMACQRVRAALLTPVGGLRLVEKAGKGTASLALAGSYALGMVYQAYTPQKEPETRLLVAGYDQGSGRYLLQDPLKKDLPQGTLLRPVWDLETDRDGGAILPAIGLFLQREEVEFAFTAPDGQEQRWMTPPPSPCLRGEIVF